jgi:ATP-binding cassette, subfamily B, bacterial
VAVAEARTDDRQGRSRSSLAPTGWRASWRGLTTVLGFAFRADPGLFISLFGVELAFGGMALLATYAIKLLTDAALAGSPDGLLVAVGAIAGGRTVQQLCGHQYVNMSIKLEERAQLLLDRRMMALVGGAAGLEHFERPEYMDELTLLRDSRRQLGQVPNAIVLNLRVLIQLVGGSILLASLHPLLLLLPVCGVPSLLLGRRATTNERLVQEADTERRRTLRQLFERATSAPAGKELRLFGLADELIGRHHRISGEILHDVARAQWQGAALRLAGTVCFTVGFTGAVALVLWRAINGLATAGDVALAVTLARQMNDGVADAVNRAGYAQRVLEAARRYLWLAAFGAAEERRPVGPGPVPVPAALTHGITLENVCFQYPGTEAATCRVVQS